MSGDGGPESEAGRSWHFLTNYTHVLLALYRDPDLRQRDVARQVGITEGAVQRILYDLERDGYIEVHRRGRRNHYSLNPDRNLRHPMEADHTIGELLERLGPPARQSVAAEHERTPQGRSGLDQGSSR